MLNSNPYINTLLENNIADPYTRKLVATGYSAALKTAMLEGKTVEKEVSMYGYTPTTGRFLDGDTIEFIDPKTNQPVVGRITAGRNFFDTVDKLRAMQDSKPKLKHQPSAIANITGSSAVDEFTAKNMSNYQAQQMLNQFSEKPEFSTYDPNTVYESVANTSVNMGVRVTGTDDYGRALVEVINPTTKRNIGVDASNNPYLNTRFDFYKSLDTAKNRSRMNASDKSFLDNVNLQALYNEISDTDGRIAEDIDLAQSTAYRSAARILQYLPFMDREHWAAVADEETGQAMADAIVGVKMSTRRDYANGMLEASDAWKKGDYVAALTGWISNIDRVIAESATQTGLIIAGGKVGAALKMGTVAAGMMGAGTAALDATLASMESFEANNNGQKMNAAQVAQSFALNLATMIPETALTALNINRFLPKPVAKEFNMLFKLKEEIKATPAYKTVLESAAGEFGQEWVQSGVEEYVSQNQDNAKSFSEVMASPERVENAVVGALAGGTMSGALAGTGAVLSTPARQAKKLADKVNAITTTAGSEADKTSSDFWSSFDVNTIPQEEMSKDAINAIMDADAEKIAQNEAVNGALSTTASETKKNYVNALLNAIGNSTDTTTDEKVALVKKLRSIYNNTKSDLTAAAVYNMQQTAQSIMKEKGVDSLSDDELKEIMKPYEFVFLGTHGRMRAAEILSDLKTTLADMREGESSYTAYNYNIESINERLANPNLTDAERVSLENEKAKNLEGIYRLQTNSLAKLRAFVEQAEYLADNPDAEESDKYTYQSGKGQGFTLKRESFFNLNERVINGLGFGAGGLLVVEAVFEEAEAMAHMLQAQGYEGHLSEIQDLFHYFLETQNEIHRQGYRGVDFEFVDDNDSDSNGNNGNNGNTNNGNNGNNGNSVIDTIIKYALEMSKSTSTGAMTAAEARKAIAAMSKDDIKQALQHLSDELQNADPSKVRYLSRLITNINKAISSKKSNRDAARQARIKFVRSVVDAEFDIANADMEALTERLKALAKARTAIKNGLRAHKATYPKEQKQQDLEFINKQIEQVQKARVDYLKNQRSSAFYQFMEGEEDFSDIDALYALEEITDYLVDDEALIKTVGDLKDNLDELIAKVKAHKHTDKTNLVQELLEILESTSAGVIRSKRGSKLIAKTMSLVKRQRFVEHLQRYEEAVADNKKEFNELLDAKDAAKSKKQRDDINAKISENVEAYQKIYRRFFKKPNISEEDMQNIQAEFTDTLNNIDTALENIMNPKPVADEMKDSALIKDYGEDSTALDTLKKDIRFTNNAESKLAKTSIDALIEDTAEESAKREQLLSIKQKLSTFKQAINEIFIPSDTTLTNDTKLESLSSSKLTVIGNNKVYIGKLLQENPAINILGNYTVDKGIGFELNDTVADVIAFSIYEYMSTYDAVNSFNPSTQKDVAAVFGLDENTVEPDLASALQTIARTYGIPQAAVVDVLGHLVARNLGISPMDTGDMTIYPKVVATLGMAALEACHIAGVVSINTASKEDLDSIYSSVENAPVIKGSRTYVSLNTKKQKTAVKEMTDSFKELDMAKNLKVEELSSNTSRLPRLTEGRLPAKMLVKNKLKMTAVPGFSRAVLQQLWNTPFTVDKTLVELLQQNEEAFKRRMGWIDEKDPNLTHDEKISAEGINRTITKQIEDLKNALKPISEGGYLDENGEIAPIYFNWFISSNGRLFMQSSTLNPQQNKTLQRFLVTTSESYKDFSWTETQLREEGYALAQAFDELEDNEHIKAFHEVITSLDEKGLDALESYVINGITDSNRTAMAELFAKLGKNKDEVEAVRNGSSNKELINLENFGQALVAVKHLKLRKANEATKSVFKTNLMIENDSTTSGYNIKYLLFPELQQEGKEYMPEKTGLSVHDDIPTDIYSDTHSLKASEGFLDIYKTGAVATDAELKNVLAAVHPEIARKFELLSPALPKVVDGRVSKELRNLMKSPTMIFGYGAAIATLGRKVSAELFENLVKDFMKIDIAYLDMSDTDIDNSTSLTDAQKAILKFFRSIAINDDLKALRYEFQTKPLYKVKSKNGTIARDTINGVLNPTFGEAVGAALEKRFERFVNINRYLNSAVKLMHKELETVVDYQIREATKSGRNLTNEEYRIILENSRGLFPELALLYSDDTSQGMSLAHTAKMYGESVDTEVDDKGIDDRFRASLFTLKKMNTDHGVVNTLVRRHAAVSLFKLANPGLRGAVLPIHFIDGMEMMMTMHRFGGAILPVHDAVVMSAFGSTEVSKYYNELSIKIGKEFDLLERMYQRTLQVCDRYDTVANNVVNKTKKVWQLSRTLPMKDIWTGNAKRDGIETVKDFLTRFRIMVDSNKQIRSLFYGKYISSVNMAGAEGSIAVVAPDEHLDLAEIHKVNDENQMRWYHYTHHFKDFVPDDTVQEVFGNLDSSERILTAFDMLNDKAKMLGGEESDIEHLNTLRDLLSAIDPSILQNVELRIQDQYVDRTGQADVRVDDGVTSGKIYVGFNPSTKDDRLSLLDPSAVEIFAHEVIHAVSSTAMLLADKLGLHKEIKQLKELRLKALDVVTWEDFMPDSYDKNLEKVLQIRAKRAFDHAFNVNNEQSLGEFLAMACTHKKFAAKLKTIALNSNNNKKLSLFQRIVQSAKTIFSVLFGKTTVSEGFPRIGDLLSGVDNRYGNATNVHEAVLDLLTKLNSAGAKAGSRYKNHIANVIDKILHAVGNISVKGDKLVGPGVSKLINILDKTDIDKAILKDLNTNRTWTALLKAMTIALFSNKARVLIKDTLSRSVALRRNQFLMSLLKDVQDTDDASQVLERIGLHTRNLDKAIQGDISITRDDLNRGFGKELTRDERRSLTVAVLRTDISCLLDNGMSVSDIKTLLTDSTALENTLNTTLNDLQSLDARFNTVWVRNSAKALALYMAKGKGNFALHFNAEHIVQSVTDSMSKKPTKQQLREITATVDKLVTLYALQQADEKAKLQAASLSEEGLSNFLQTHRTLVKHTSNNSFKYAVKGHTKRLSIPDVNYSVELADKREDALGVSTVAEFKDNTFSSITGKLVLKRENFFAKTHREGATFVFVSAKLIGDSFTQVVDMQDNEAAYTRIVADATNKAKQQMTYKEMTIEELEKMSVPYIPTPTKAFADTVNDVRVVIDHDTEENVMHCDLDGIEILSNMYGFKNMEMDGHTVNSAILNFLINDVKDNMDPSTHMLKNTDTKFSKAGVHYMRIGSNVENGGLKPEEWRVLPAEIKRYIQQNGELYIREDWLPELLGIPTISLSNKATNMYLKRAITIAEHILKSLALITKHNILFRTPAVLVGNVISNLAYSVMTGHSFIEVMKLTLQNCQNLTSYLRTQRQLLAIQHKQEIGSATRFDLQKLDALNKKLEENPVHPLMKAGLFQAIIEDVDSSKTETLGGISRKLKESTLYKKSPSWLKEVTRQMYMAEGTLFYDTVFQATQYSDFVARATQYQLEMKKRGLKPGDKTTVEQENALISELLEAFVNYDKPSSSIEQYLNDIGLTMFTKYFKRMQRVIRQQVVKRPISTLFFALSQMNIIDIEDPLEQNIFNKNYGAIWHSPVDNLISAFSPQLIVQLAD